MQAVIITHSEFGGSLADCYVLLDFVLRCGS
jgi:hypothetical protein